MFSGIGGIELGFEWEGFTTTWCIENDKYAQTILRKRFPEAVIYGDITEIDFNTIPKIDILTGGFPCQDISNAGKRIGISGSRSSLWKYYAKAIGILRPKYIFIENVSAILKRGLDVVLSDIAALGYDAEWHCVPASAIGAPHQRDRIFIIGWPATNVVNSDSNGTMEQRRDRRYQERHATKEIQKQCNEQLGVICPGTDVSNLHSKSLERSQCKHEKTLFTGNSREKSIKSDGWWAIEPKLGRVANGVPNRVDRIKCLGNAVVPQLAQVFAQVIREKEAEGK